MTRFEALYYVHIYLRKCFVNHMLASNPLAFMQTTKGKTFLGKIKSTCNHTYRKGRKGFGCFLMGQARGFFLSEEYRFLETWAKKKKDGRGILRQWLFVFYSSLIWEKSTLGWEASRMRGIPITHKICWKHKEWRFHLPQSNSENLQAHIFEDE